jgi:hypothetical protein
MTYDFFNHHEPRIVTSLNGKSGPITIKNLSKTPEGHFQVEAPNGGDNAELYDRVTAVEGKLNALRAKTDHIIADEESIQLSSGGITVGISGSFGVSITGTPTIETGYPTTVLSGKTCFQNSIEMAPGTKINSLDNSSDHPFGQVAIGSDLDVNGDLTTHSVNKVTIEGAEEGLRFTWRSFTDLLRIVIIPWEGTSSSSSSSGDLAVHIPGEAGSAGGAV